MQTLDVINQCLATMGERPIAALNTPHRFLDAAKSVLNTKRRVHLALGWWFNTETNILAPQAVTGYVILGNDVMNVKPDVCNSQYVVRGLKLYDKDLGSYEIGKSLTVEVIRDIPFEDIPESVAQYIAAEAVLQFQSDFDGDSDKRRKLSDSRDRALILANADQTRYSQANFLTQSARLQAIKARMRRRIY
jgi:hypothetical protein